MDLRSEIQQVVYNKTENQQLVHRIFEANKEEELIRYFFEPFDTKYTPKISYLFMLSTDLYLERLAKFIEVYNQKLSLDLPESVIRNVLRFFNFYGIPESCEDKIADISLQLLPNPKTAIAVRVYCMTNIYLLSKRYPELGTELSAILQDILQKGCSPGERSRANRIMKELG